jgi:type II secretory pathway predicted ATPase ExeA
LAGEGRLLSLVARDRRLEQMVSLRGVIPPFTLDETRMLVAARLAAAGSLDERDQVARTIHEIAAGIPAVVTRIADLAAVVVEASPGRTLVPDDIEAIHRRLSLQAA